MLLGICCRKEYSYEGGTASLIASGSLSDSLGNCGRITVNGSYKPNIALTDNNHITVQANISSFGSYTIYTDTVNGYYFNAKGYAGAAGLQPVQLQGYGTPLVAAVAQFALHFNNGICMFTIVPDSATFNLSGNCGNIVVNGIYATGVLLNAGDSVNIRVNVTSPGAYSIATPTVNGMQFSATGTFTAAGNYSVTLTGSGTPVTAGNTTLPVTIAGTSCNFTIPVTGDTLNYPMFWRYTVDGIDHQGILDSGIVATNVNRLYPSNLVRTMQVYGAASGPLLIPLTFQLFISRINHVLTTGSYHPAINGSRDFIGYALHFDTTGNLSASADLPDFTIVIITYNDATRLVEGVFSGPVIDEYGQTHTIANGSFATYFKK